MYAREVVSALEQRGNMREQIEQLIAYLEVWDHNVTVGMQRAIREPFTEFNKGSQFGQNEVLKVSLDRLNAILADSKPVSGEIDTEGRG